MTRVSVAMDGDSQATMDGAKRSLTWESQPRAEQLLKTRTLTAKMSFPQHNPSPSDHASSI